LKNISRTEGVQNVGEIVAFKLRPPPAPPLDPELGLADPFLAVQAQRREAYWNEDNWRTLSRGNRYVVIDENRCVTVFRRFGAFGWAIARDGWSPLFAEQTCPSEAAARRDAWETLAELI
jgi:hypothetical protein